MLKLKPRRRVSDAGKPLVLYVEDEDANWRVSAKALERHCALRRAKNAREAIDALRAEAFRAILVDIQLADSELNGIEIVRLLRGDPRSPRPPWAEGFSLDPVPPIVFVTAYSARYSREDLLHLGADEVINKPVELAQLERAVASAIALSLARSSGSS